MAQSGDRHNYRLAINNSQVRQSMGHWMVVNAADDGNDRMYLGAMDSIKRTTLGKKCQPGK